MDPMISVVMSVYNAEKYLKDSIESILNQTYRNFEFIIIDDGSSDNSLNIINGFREKDNRIIVVSRSNKGVVVSLNDGIKISRGKYIAIMDADDISLRNRLEKQLEYMEKNTDVSILATNVDIFGNIGDEEKKYIEQAYNFTIRNDNDAKAEILKYCCIAHDSVIMRKTYMDEIGYYNENFKRCEDYELWIRTISHGYKIRKLDEKLLKVRRHKDSKSYVDLKGGMSLYDNATAKLNYLDKVLKNNHCDCFIWGASNGGNIVLNVIKSNNKFNVLGFIDKYKKGMFNNYPIYDIQSLDKNMIKGKYILIATSPGREEAFNILNKLGLEYINDYMYLL